MIIRDFMKTFIILASEILIVKATGKGAGHSASVLLPIFQLLAGGKCPRTMPIIRGIE